MTLYYKLHNKHYIIWSNIQHKLTTIKYNVTEIISTTLYKHKDIAVHLNRSGSTPISNRNNV